MSSPKPADPPPPPPVHLDLPAALLSYLVPGLGQIYQGRVRKGLLFLVALYALFFYGMYLGKWQNVYLPDYDKKEQKGGATGRLGSNIYTRFQIVGQFPIGVVAWPAVYQYYSYDENDANPPLDGWMRAPSMDRLNQLQRDTDKTWDLGWVYTIIAGVLNVLVIYDALAGPAFRETKAAPGPVARPIADGRGAGRVNIYIHLPILIVVVSLVYSATRHDNWNKIFHEAVHWGFRMTTFLVSIGLILFALSTFL